MKNEMGRTCGTYQAEMHAGFWCGNMKEKEHLEDLRTDGKIILK
jgi:hypothetical protein